MIIVDAIVLYRVSVQHKKERGKLLLVSFILIATCLGLGQTTISIIAICIESCASRYFIIYMIINYPMVMNIMFS